MTRVRLYCNGSETEVKPFVSRFTANVCRAIVNSLKTPRFTSHIDFILKGDLIELRVDQTPVPLDRSQGFAEIMVRDTIRGMIQHLKDIDPGGTIRIEVDLEGNLEESQG
jgi:hypothetical protein